MGQDVSGRVSAPRILGFCIRFSQSVRSEAAGRILSCQRSRDSHRPLGHKATGKSALQRTECCGIGAALPVFASCCQGRQSCGRLGAV
eukprot:10323200-Lingulodinium_polyedra.AAC.1